MRIAIRLSDSVLGRIGAYWCSLLRICVTKLLKNYFHDSSPKRMNHKFYPENVKILIIIAIAVDKTRYLSIRSTSNDSETFRSCSVE